MYIQPLSFICEHLGTPLTHEIQFLCFHLESITSQQTLYLLANLFITGVKCRVTATMATHSRNINVAITPITILARFKLFCSSLKL